MKSLVFDSSSIISITTNNLLDILVNLKKIYRGEFFICHEVLKELIENPLKTHKFKLEALQLSNYLSQGKIKVFNKDLENKTNYLLTLANNIFQVNNHNLIILHKADVESLALTLYLQAESLVIDERTTRLLIENFSKLQDLLERKLNTKVKINKENLNYFKKEVKDIKIIRSSELMTIAFELDLFKGYENKSIKNFKKELLEGILWGLRLRGCAISTEEINRIIKLEKLK